MSSRSKRIDDLAVEAIEDIKKKADEENLRIHGYKLNIGFVQASRVLGAKYFKKHFGKMPIDEVIRTIEMKNRKNNKWGKL